MVADRQPILDEDPETRCPRCTGGVENLRGTGDRALFGPITEKDPTPAKAVETGALAELPNEYLREVEIKERPDPSQ